MNAKEQLIMEEYREAKPDFERLEKEVAAILQDIADSCNIQIYAINHRIKEEKSLAGKLERKGDKYSSLSESVRSESIIVFPFLSFLTIVILLRTYPGVIG